MEFAAVARTRDTEDPLQALSDDALVLAAQAGDKCAFGELWLRHSRMVHRVLLRVTENPEDAEDVEQETFLKAFVHLNRFEARAKFSTWLTRIAINSGLMFLRRQRSRPTLSIDSQFEDEPWNKRALQDRSQDIESSYLRTERAAVVERALRKLKPALASIIRHQLLNECSMAETAERHGLSVPATKSRLLRAKKALRVSLARRE